MAAWDKVADDAVRVRLSPPAGSTLGEALGRVPGMPGGAGGDEQAGSGSQSPSASASPRRPGSRARGAAGVLGTRKRVAEEEYESGAEHKGGGEEGWGGASRHRRAGGGGMRRRSLGAGSGRVLAQAASEGGGGEEEGEEGPQHRTGAAVGGVGGKEEEAEQEEGVIGDDGSDEDYPGRARARGSPRRQPRAQTHANMSPNDDAEEIDDLDHKPRSPHRRHLPSPSPPLPAQAATVRTGRAGTGPGGRVSGPGVTAGGTASGGPPSVAEVRRIMEAGVSAAVSRLAVPASRVRSVVSQNQSVVRPDKGRVYLQKPFVEGSLAVSATPLAVQVRGQGASKVLLQHCSTQ